MNKQTVAIIDFGSQYTQLIARRVREHKVYSEIFPHTVTAVELSKKNIVSIILSGGPSSVYENDSPYLSKMIFDLNVPVLGICYGFQLLIDFFNGLVESSGRAEYGRSNIQFKSKSKLFSDINKSTDVWMSHGDKVTNIPKGWQVTSRSENNVVSSSEHETDQFYGVQFHPEVIHTIDGEKIISKSG